MCSLSGKTLEARSAVAETQEEEARVQSRKSFLAESSDILMGLPYSFHDGVVVSGVAVGRKEACAVSWTGCRTYGSTLASCESQCKAWWDVQQN